jgi:chromosome segregation ATPase
MTSRKSMPGWLNKGSFFMKSNIDVLTEEERMAKHRDEIAQILIENCASIHDHDYYHNMMSEIEEDMNSINDFIVNDNLRLRDNYLNDQLARCDKEISSKIDYDLKIKELTECIESIKQKISRLFDEITELSNKLGEIKKNKPFTPRNKQPIITPEEEVINTRLEKIPHDKNNLEELISSYESTIENYRNFKVAQDDNISYAEKNKQFILDNWERYEHDGTMIILPSRP